MKATIENTDRSQNVTVFFIPYRKERSSQIGNFRLEGWYSCYEAETVNFLAFMLLYPIVSYIIICDVQHQESEAKKQLEKDCEAIRSVFRLKR